ncbi:serine hydrolase domain-containing protein [Streptomyces sp. NBC_01445]|uniref:serine hydrolase domain-containing protein n=1 Tax=Streptomyces sp. NBC_01445 TaxID=2903869 RepID=UPI002DD9261A|nr:serine hydrolase domain-containing protein [Streptomyces sp. NBC_01445]WSE02109.1 beta-lactamase family protein [Streptomyces sp. NBC_01445]WSE10220.1 beta-lactamase family protein [Streptomyces sp. NBC_01445]
MTVRTRTALATSLVLAIAAGPVAASPVFAASPSLTASAPRPDAKALRAAIAGLPDADATAALVRVAGTDGSWRGSSGVAEIGSGHKALEQGRFRAGSTTKVFTAAVVLQLAAEHRIDLAASVQDYLPGLLPDSPPISVRQLLNHTSGLQEAHDDKPFAEAYEHRFGTVTPRQLVAASAAKSREFAPGTQQHYVGVNYTLLGLLIETTTGGSYEQQVSQRILRPLGLRHTSFPGTDPRIHGPHNHGYQAVKSSDGTTELRDVTQWNVTDVWATGNLISTTADLERFLHALFRGQVVPKAQLKEMFTVPQGIPLYGSDQPAMYSAGLTRFTLQDGTVGWGKTGGLYGYNTAVLGVRDLSRTLVYSVNSTDAKGSEMNKVVRRIISAAFTH